MITTSYRNAASERQTTFMIDMLTEIFGGNAITAQSVFDRNVAAGLLSDRDRVRTAVDKLIMKRDAHREANRAAKIVVTVEPGRVYYSAQGIVRVVLGKVSGNVYAEVLRDGNFEYDRGAITRLERDVTARMMTLDEAKRESVLFGKCIRCDAKLKPAKDGSQRFIGPVCVKYFD